MKPTNHKCDSKGDQERQYLKQLVRELKKENLRLQKKLAKTEAKFLSATNQITALQELKDPHGDIAHCKYLRSLSDEQLDAEILRLQSGRQSCSKVVPRTGSASPAVKIRK